jgi:phytoene synthase
MTNFLRDVGEDVVERGRIYLPLEDLRRHDVSEEMLQKGEVVEAFIVLMKFEIERTKKLYAVADEGILLLPKRARRGIRVARVLYSSILGKIEHRGYDVFSARTSLSFLEKVGLLCNIIIKKI